MNIGDLPAMPLTSDVNPHGANAGLTKREYFTALAMQGILANPNCEPTKDEHFWNIACDAINTAETVLEKLEENTQ